VVSAQDAASIHMNTIPPGTKFSPYGLRVLCMRSKAWLAARVSLRLARLPCTASSAQRSRHLRSTCAAAPVLLAHAEVTKTIICFQIGQKLRYPVLAETSEFYCKHQSRRMCWLAKCDVVSKQLEYTRCLTCCGMEYQLASCIALRLLLQSQSPQSAAQHSK
jgi:hypothetical protein